MANSIPTFLTAARERCERATKGPWKWDGTVWNYDEEQEAPWLVSPLPPHPEMGCGYVKVIHGQVHCSEVNAEFIAHAREDLPRALAALEVAVNYIGSRPCFCSETTDRMIKCEGCAVRERIEKILGPQGEGAEGKA